jgi:hypothetical protein
MSFNCLFIFIPATNLDDTKTIFDDEAENLVMHDNKYLFISGKYVPYFP